MNEIERILSTDNYSSILNVKYGDSEAIIRQNFKKIAQIIHPDKIHTPDSLRAFQKLVQARDYLLAHGIPNLESHLEELELIIEKKPKHTKDTNFKFSIFTLISAIISISVLFLVRNLFSSSIPTKDELLKLKVVFIDKAQSRKPTIKIRFSLFPIYVDAEWYSNQKHSTSEKSLYQNIIRTGEYLYHQKNE